MVSAPHQAPQSWDPVPERGIPTTTGWENQQGHSPDRWRASVEPDILLKGLSKDLLTHTALGSSEGSVTRKVPRTCGKELNCLALGQWLKGKLSLELNGWQAPLVLC